MLLIKGIGLVAAGDNAKQCDIILDVFEDAMKIAWLTDSFGGPHPMTQEQIIFIDNWEVENYRRSVAAIASKAVQRTGPLSLPVLLKVLGKVLGVASFRKEPTLWWPI